ncbi:MAG: hypothetical protein AVDCRST_MAG64-1118 [uncultured Phycisphaerae bacterium]|uniref:Uncharacterized protein n=1 Tax=uncultured Phycisphaerae bacterium TaxID=904963 RepID=A0A6J4NHT7_9BACT|nr:MAG: hypothetical protein AVDCRST_MAG64-1118 [uncultured Phycisphaerae bacterium]
MARVSELLVSGTRRTHGRCGRSAAGPRGALLARRRARRLVRRDTAGHAPGRTDFRDAGRSRPHLRERDARRAAAAQIDPRGAAADATLTPRTNRFPRRKCPGQGPAKQGAVGRRSRRVGSPSRRAAAERRGSAGTPCAFSALDSVEAATARAVISDSSRHRPRAFRCCDARRAPASPARRRRAAITCPRRPGERPRAAGTTVRRAPASGGFGAARYAVAATAGSPRARHGRDARRVRSNAPECRGRAGTVLRLLRGPRPRQGSHRTGTTRA